MTRIGNYRGMVFITFPAYVKTVIAGKRNCIHYLASRGKASFQFEDVNDSVQPRDISNRLSGKSVFPKMLVWCFLAHVLSSLTQQH